MGSSDITNVYAALDRTHTVVALERSRRGDEGFRTFYDEFADYAADKGYIPYLLLLNFHVDDGSRLPPIEAKERGYRLAHLAPLEVKDIRQALTLYDLLYCRKHGLDPLAVQNTARNLCYKDDYAGFRNESIPALKQPGAPYRAVETEGGVALFRWGGSDFPGYDFPFADRFKNADRESAAAMTDDSRTTAADILRTCFGIDPAREEPPCPLPSGDIRFYRDFLSIDLLFRPERLLERYERDRDRREMPCHILKH